MDSQPENSFVFCKKCGTKLPADSEYCNKCGTKLNESTPDPAAEQQSNENAKKKKTGLVIAAVVAVLVIALLAIFIFAPCLLLGHEWADATCTEPKTCTVCAETEGKALGHEWADATCTDPKTCTVCAETEGKPLGHEWADATCTEPRICAVCAETEGKALGHEWKKHYEVDVMDETEFTWEHCENCQLDSAGVTRPLTAMHRDGVFLLSLNELAEKVEDELVLLDSDLRITGSGEDLFYFEDDWSVCGVSAYADGRKDLFDSHEIPEFRCMFFYDEDNYGYEISLAFLAALIPGWDLDDDEFLDFANELVDEDIVCLNGVTYQRYFDSDYDAHVFFATVDPVESL